MEWSKPNFANTNHIFYVSNKLIIARDAAVTKRMSDGVITDNIYASMAITY